VAICGRNFRGNIILGRGSDLNKRLPPNKRPSKIISFYGFSCAEVFIQFCTQHFGHQELDALLGDVLAHVTTSSKRRRIFNVVFFTSFNTNFKFEILVK
jgi:hypothetical protein